MAATNETAGVWLGRIALAVLGILSLICIFTGGIFYGWIVSDWMQSGTPFSGLQMLGWVLGLIAAGGVCAGLLLAGIAFRFLAWRHAPRASLVLAAISVLFIIATYAIFSDTGRSDDSIEVVFLQALCILCLFVVSLPPFLHWLLARRNSSAIGSSGVER